MPLISASTQEQPEVIAPKKRDKPPMTEEQEEKAKRKRLKDKQKKDDNNDYSLTSILLVSFLLNIMSINMLFISKLKA